MTGAWERWVRLWDAREPATSLALVRILVALVIAFDLVEVLRLDLVEVLWAPRPEGGLGFLGAERSVPAAYHLLGTSASTAWLLFAASLGAALALAAGAYSRTAAAVLLVSQAQLAAALPQGDRGIDTALRWALLLLACSQAGRTLSFDAWRRTGSFRDATPVTAWPRYLLSLQLLWIYFSAGVNKTQLSWYPPGGLMALHDILHDPHFARFDPSWLAWGAPLTQVATFATMTFELGAPLVLASPYFEARPDAGGRLRRALARVRLREVFLVTGVLFHLGIALTMRLGIFPFGMLALYPALLPPRRMHIFILGRAGGLRKQGETSAVSTNPP